MTHPHTETMSGNRPNLTAHQRAGQTLAVRAEEASAQVPSALSRFVGAVTGGVVAAAGVSIAWRAGATCVRC
jgi:uncharacterized membrane-anchored protein YitT (DUF2179 family)